MGGKDSKLMDDVIKVTTVMKDTVIYVQKGVKNLAGVHNMREALKQVGKVHDQLDKEEREALQTMITANSQVGLAVHFARVAVRTCKSIVETVRRVITAEKGEMSQKLILAIRVYVQRVKDLMPKLKKARDELKQAQVLLEKAIVGLEILKGWCNRKISEMEGKADSEVVEQRAIAYGGAAGGVAVVAGGVAIVNWWNPVGCVAAAVVIGGAAAVAGGVAAGVTEGITVGALRKEYGRLNDATKLFEDMSKNAEENVVELDKKTEYMTEIEAVAQQSFLNGEMAITVDVDGVMFDIFKKDVFDLDKLCHDYLNAPDMPKDHQEEEPKA